MILVIAAIVIVAIVIVALVIVAIVIVAIVVVAIASLSFVCDGIVVVSELDDTMMIDVIIAS